MKIFSYGIERISNILINVFKEEREITFTKEDNSYDVLYINFGSNLVTKKGLIIILKNLMLKKPIIVHWIGSDVYYFYKERNCRDIKFFIKYCLLKIVSKIPLIIHWSAAEHLQKELLDLGINSKVVYLPTELCEVKHVEPLPNKIRVLSYLPDINPEFYRASTVLQLAENNLDIEFHIVGNKGENYKNYPNVIFHGWVTQNEMNRLYDLSTCVIRIPIHDALGGTVIEGVLRGRYAIWSYESNYSIKATDFSSAHKALDYIRKQKELNIKGREFVTKHYSLEILKNKFKAELIEDLKWFRKIEIKKYGSE